MFECKYNTKVVSKCICIQAVVDVYGVFKEKSDNLIFLKGLLVGISPMASPSYDGKFDYFYGRHSSWKMCKFFKFSYE